MAGAVPPGDCFRMRHFWGSSRERVRTAFREHGVREDLIQLLVRNCYRQEWANAGDYSRVGGLFYDFQFPYWRFPAGRRAFYCVPRCTGMSKEARG